MVPGGCWAGPGRAAAGAILCAAVANLAIELDKRDLTAQVRANTSTSGRGVLVGPDVTGKHHLLLATHL